MNRIIIKILSYPIKYIFKIYFFCSEDGIKYYKRKNLNSLLKIVKTLILKIGKFVNESIFSKCIPFSHAKILSEVKYISNIKEFFYDRLEDIHYTLITPKLEIEFNDYEKVFLRLVNKKSLYYLIPKRNFLIQKGYRPKLVSNFKFQREVFYCAFNNVKFIGPSGILIQNGRGILESAFSVMRLIRIKKFFNLIVKRRKLRGVYTSIMHWDYETNQYHFLIDNLTRLYAITEIKEPKINLIIPKNYNKAHLKIVKLFLDDRFKVIAIGTDEIWEIEKFYFSSFCAGDYLTCIGYIPKKYLDFVKNKIFEEFGIKKANRTKRIYISRKKANRRRILNEDQLCEVLKKYNFETVYLEDITFKEEVELFNSVSLVISPMGAGLTNIIFSENIKVLEFHMPSLVQPYYFMICKTLGFIYRYFIGYGQEDNQDFRVDLIEVESAINELIQD